MVKKKANFDSVVNEQDDDDELLYGVVVPRRIDYSRQMMMDGHGGQH